MKHWRKQMFWSRSQRYNYTQNPHKNKPIKYIPVINLYEGFCPFLPLSYRIHIPLPCWHSVIATVVYRPPRNYSIGLHKKAVEPLKEWQKGVRKYMMSKERNQNIQTLGKEETLGTTARVAEWSRSPSQLAEQKGWQPLDGLGTASKPWTPAPLRLGPELRTEQSPLYIWRT